MSDGNAKTIEIAQDLVEAYQERVRKLPGGFRAYEVRDSDYVHFIKVALHFEKDSDFDPELFMTSAFSLRWFLKGKPIKRPYPFQLTQKSVYGKYRALKAEGMKEGTKKERICKAVEDSLWVLKNLAGRRKSIHTLTPTQILETLKGRLISVYLIVMWPHIRQHLERKITEAFLDNDPLGMDTWKALSDEVTEACYTVQQLGCARELRDILEREGLAT